MGAVSGLCGMEEYPRAQTSQDAEGLSGRVLYICSYHRMVEISLVINHTMHAASGN